MLTYGKGTLKQIVRALDKDIREMEEKIKDFKISDSVKDDLASLKTIRGNISQLSIDISKLDTKIEFSERTIETLEKTRSSIDPKIIKGIYQQAKVYIEKLQKSFQETMSFHNSMIDNKVKFVNKSLTALKEKKKVLWDNLTNIQREERECLKKMSHKGALEDFQNYNNRLSSLKEERGEKNGILIEIDKVEKELHDLNKELDVINEKIATFQDRLDRELEIFNISYRNISKKLYDEEYVFAYNSENNEGYNFSIDSMRGKVGSGKKKGEIMAFDLAYLKFLENKQANICRFQIHDRIEEVHTNQLKSAFKIATEIDGQFIIPVLGEKVESLGSEYIKNNTIISLSQNEKFFKL